MSWETLFALPAVCEGNPPERSFDAFFTVILEHAVVLLVTWDPWRLRKQSGRSPKVVALFSATNFSSNIIELLQLHDTIQI